MMPRENSTSASTHQAQLPQNAGRVLVIAEVQAERDHLCHLLAQCGYTTQSAPTTERALQYLADDCHQEPRFAAGVLRLPETVDIESAAAEVQALSATECALPVLVVAAEDAALDRALSEAGDGAFLPRSTLNEATLERALRYVLARRAVEREMHAKTGHQNAIAETTPVVIVTINEHSTIEYINPAVQDMLGYAPDEVIGRSLTIFMSEADAIRHVEGMTRYLRTGERRMNWQASEVNVVARDGHSVLVEVTFSEYTLGGRRHFAAALRDVSEQKQAQEALRQSEARYAHIAANVPGMLYQFVLRPDGSSYFAFVSEGVNNIFGVSPARAYENADFLYEMVHPEDRDEFRRLVLESARQIKIWQWHGRILHSDGEVRWVEVCSQPTPQPNGDLIYDGMMLDATAQRHAEIELNKARIELENRVEQRTQELAHANETLQAQIDARKRGETAIRRHARQQEALAQLSQTALSDIALPVFLRGAVALAAATMNVHFGNISYLDESGQNWLTPHIVGWPTEVSQRPWPLVENSALHQVLKSGVPVTVDDWYSEMRWTLPQVALEAGVVSTIYVRIPGTTSGSIAAPYGVLAAHSEVRRHFSINDIQFLQAMANIIATTLQRRQLNAELLETSQRLQAVLDNASVNIFIKDLQGRYILANKRLQTFHDGLSPGSSSLLGRSDIDFMPPAVAARVEASDQRLIKEKQHHAYEVSFENPDGTQHFLITKFPLFDAQGEVSGVGGIATDITDRKNAELAREAARGEAEIARIEAEQARIEAEIARHGADRANRAKSEFLSRMSHELRTPLNAVIGFAQLLESTELPPRSQQGVQQILRAGRHLLNLINEVLDMASIEAGRLNINLQTTTARPILDEVLDLLQPLAAQNQVSLRHKYANDCDLSILVDPQRLLQILLNLVSNAIKYNRPGGEVFVSCHRSGSASEARLQIRVRDTGRGIVPENMARLWEPFDRLDEENRAIEGTGLGLTLSRTLAQTMNGTLDAISTPGEGSTFWIELPLVSLSQ